jgi:UDP:flavonoid glycosyltransferase YjiC (YdhE family)
MKVLVYTSPARGHLYPLVPTLLELRDRGHEVVVVTLADEVERVRSLGMKARAMAPAIEAREIDDWKAGSPPAALLAACRTFIDRGQHEIGDLGQAIAEERPEILYTDVNSWGAAAVAEASGLPWAVFAPYFLPIRAPGVPPWGLGLAPSRGLFGRLRDALLWPIVNRLYDRALTGLNALRVRVGVPGFRHVADMAGHPPCIVAYTACPFEYDRAWPPGVHLVGPGVWEPPAATVQHDDPRPLVLVTCSTEYQNDGRLIATALEALAGEPVRVVATTASIDPATFTAPPNARIERFVPHGPLLAEAAVVVCHGGMGITQKALAAGVPVCVVPFGRDQIEVARHVEVAGAGTRLAAGALRPERLRRAVARAMTLKPGALRVAEAFARAGGASGAADVIEGLAVRQVS